MEKELLELQKAKEQADKRLLNIEIVLGIISTVSFLIMFYVSLYAIVELKMYLWPIIMLVVGIAIFVVGLVFCLIIDNKHSSIYGSTL